MVMILARNLDVLAGKLYNRFKFYYLQNQTKGSTFRAASNSAILFVKYSNNRLYAMYF